VRLKGERAELRCRSAVRFPGGHDVYGLAYNLRKTSGGWKVYAGRWWLLERRRGARRTVYDARTWKSLDEAVEKCRKRKDLRGQARALQDAFRFAEAHALAREVTARPRATAEDWVLRADVAFHAGKLEDVLPSLRRARSLDPRVGLAGHLRAALELAKGSR
jgi:hypothetical protein